MGFDIGAHVGRYVILRPLGRGASGLVFVAFDPQLDREVALKLLRARGKSGDEEAQQRLLEEAQALARLSHPHVVDVYDVGTWEDRVYIALEYVEGHTLTEWAKDQARSVDDVVEVFAQAGEGLAAAHAAGIVHLDFKPSNAIVDESGMARVLDFGLARRREAPRSSTGAHADDVSASHGTGTDTRSSGGRAPRLVGTPGYIAPESYVGAEPGPAADQFALCVSLWEILHGERPFDGESRAEIRDAVLDGEPRSTVRRVPRAVDAVIRRGLRTSPEDRFESMEALVAQLRRTRDRRNLWLLLGVAMPIVAIAGYAYARSFGGEQGVCQAGPRRFAQAWSEDDRAQVRRSFDASGELYAPRTFELVSAGLDSYRERWVHEYTDACEATRLLGEQSEQLLDLRMACLEERRLSVAALVDVLAEADGSVVEQAPPALERLPDVRGCSNREALLRRTEAGEPQRGERFDAMVRELASVEALALTDDLETAMQRARTVLEEARSLESGAHQARAHMALAGFWERQGDIDQAIVHANDALFVADAAGADETRVSAAVALLWFHGHSKAEYERSRWFEKVARSVIGRLDAPANKEILLLENTAGVALDEGRHDDAIAILEDVLARTKDERSFAQSGRLNSLAGAHFNGGRFEAARSEYQRALQMRIEILGAQHPYVGDLLCNLALAHHALDDSEAAVRDMRAGLELVETAKGPTENSLRTIHNNFAVILQDLGRHDEAARYYRKALEGWRSYEPQHAFIGLLLANFADLELQRKRFSAADRLAAEALEHLAQRELAEHHPYVAYAATALGRARLGAGDASGAVEPLERAVAILQKTSANAEATADAYAALADAVEATGGSAQRVDTLRAKALATRRREPSP